MSDDRNSDDLTTNENMYDISRLDPEFIKMLEYRVKLYGYPSVEALWREIQDNSLQELSKEIDRQVEHLQNGYI